MGFQLEMHRECLWALVICLLQRVVIVVEITSLCQIIVYAIVYSFIDSRTVCMLLYISVYV